MSHVQKLEFRRLLRRLTRTNQDPPFALTSILLAKASRARRPYFTLKLKKNILSCISDASRLDGMRPDSSKESCLAAENRTDAGLQWIFNAGWKTRRTRVSMTPFFLDRTGFCSQIGPMIILWMPSFKVLKDWNHLLNNIPLWRPLIFIQSRPINRYTVNPSVLLLIFSAKNLNCLIGIIVGIT